MLVATERGARSGDLCGVVGRLQLVAATKFDPVQRHEYAPVGWDLGSSVGKELRRVVGFDQARWRTDKKKSLLILCLCDFCLPTFWAVGLFPLSFVVFGSRVVQPDTFDCCPLRSTTSLQPHTACEVIRVVVYLNSQLLWCTRQGFGPLLSHQPQLLAI